MTAKRLLLTFPVVFAAILTLGVAYWSSKALLSALPETEPRQVLGGVNGAFLLACLAMSCAISFQVWAPMLPRLDVILATTIVLALPSTSVGLILDPEAFWLICLVMSVVACLRLRYLICNLTDLPFRVSCGVGVIAAVVWLSLATLAYRIPQVVIPSYSTLICASVPCMFAVSISAFVTRSRRYYLSIMGILTATGVACFAQQLIPASNSGSGIDWFNAGQIPFVIFSVFCFLSVMLPLIGFFGFLNDLVLLRDDHSVHASVASLDDFFLCANGVALILCAVLLFALGKLSFFVMGMAISCAILYLSVAFCYDFFAADSRNAGGLPMLACSPQGRVFNQTMWRFHFCLAFSGLAVTVATGIWHFSSFSTLALILLSLGTIVLLVFGFFSLIFSEWSLRSSLDSRDLRRFWTLSLVALFLYTSGLGIGVIGPRLIIQMVPYTQIAAAVDTLRNCGTVVIRSRRSEFNLQFERKAAPLGALDSKVASIVKLDGTSQGQILALINYRTPLYQPIRSILSVDFDELAPLCQHWLVPTLKVRTHSQ